MSVATVTNILAALEIADRLIAAGVRYAAVARAAMAEGRDISPEELAALQAEDDAARATLDAAIAARRAADAKTEPPGI